METIRNGSRGSDVKTLQGELNKRGGYGLAEDGIFGAKTEAAVRDFQKRNGLDADGICGVKTWGVLGFNATSNATSNTTSSKCIDPSVIYKRLPLPGEKDSNGKPLPVHITKSAGRVPKYLAIHYTAGAHSKPGRAIGNYDTFMKREASADFAVDDRDMVQFNPDIDNYYCWAVGDKKNPYSSGGWLYGRATNKNTISIEVCSNLKSGTSASAANHEGWYFTEEALANAEKLARIIMRRYNIPVGNVVRHYDISGKLCPGVIGWNDEAIYDTKGNKTKGKSESGKWLEFKRRLAQG